MLVRLSDHPDGRVAMFSPYEPRFIASFKAALPWEGREWDKAGKRWLLQPPYVPDFLLLCRQEGIQVSDGRSVQAERTAREDPYASMPGDLRGAFACLYLAPNAPLCVAEASHKALARVFHPDRPYGDTEIMERINDSITIVRRYFAPEETS